MKKVLIISYYFPPAGGSAVQRPLKFVKYLRDFGWEPVVLTAKMSNHSLVDPSLCREIPEGVIVSRAAAPDPYRLFARLKGARTESADLAAIAMNEVAKPGWLSRLSMSIRNAFFVPDARIGWLPFAFFRGLKLIKKHNVDVIFVTSPPFTSALVGHCLSQLSGVPWISDYRDPWTQAYYYFRRPWPVRSIEIRWEKQCLKSAFRVISINQLLLDDLEKKYRIQDPNKWEVIPNGFDPQDFEDLEPVRDEAHFTIVYTGTQNSKMNAAPLLEAIRLLLQKDPNIEKQLRLHLIGRIGPDIQSLFDDEGLSGMIRVSSFLPHKECLRHTAGADLLLLIIPQTENHRIIVTGKLFEYLISGNPILALAEEGLASSILNETGAGMAFSPRNINPIVDFLRNSLERWIKKEPLLTGPSDKNEIQKYSRKNGAGRLADIFNQTMKNT